MPIVFRGPNGAAAGVAAQHSQDFSSWYSHCPGLKVRNSATYQSLYCSRATWTSLLPENFFVVLIHKHHINNLPINMLAGCVLDSPIETRSKLTLRILTQVDRLVPITVRMKLCMSIIEPG